MADTNDRSTTSPRDNSSSGSSSGRQRPRFGWLRSLLGLNGAGDNAPRGSLEEVIGEHEDLQRNLTQEEQHMLVNILKFGELRVEDVMVPRTDIVAVEENATLEECLELYRASSHSRMPVYRETLDDPIGMVHLKDLILWLAPHGTEGAASRRKFSLRDVRRDVLFVPPSMPLLDLLMKMQARHIHLALVIDEHGGTDGLVSIEDLVEEIVGEIEDEHDTDSGPALHRRDDGTIDVEARCPIEELEEAIGLRLIDEEDEDDVDTVAGLVFSMLGRVPVRGETVAHPAGIEFEVKEADPRRIVRLRVHLPTSSDDASATASETES